MSESGHSRPIPPIMADILCQLRPVRVRTGVARNMSRWATNGLMHRSKANAISITSFALTKMDFGIDKPSSFAVRGLTTSSWAVGSSTGMSPGLVPFRGSSCLQATAARAGVGAFVLARKRALAATPPLKSTNTKLNPAVS
jgi:hypothetical protein